MATLGQLEKRLRDNISPRRSQRTVDNYVWRLRCLVRDTGKTEWTRSDLVKYFSETTAKLKPKSIEQYYHALQSVFKLIGQPFHLTPDDLPSGRAYPVNQFTISKDDIQRLIDYARQDGAPDERFFLAVSTTYGARRIEMARLSGLSFNLSAPSIVFDTAKHGKPRHHGIPAEVLSYISSYDMASLPVPEYMLSILWNRLCKNAGYSSPDGEAWHSVRRSLTTELVIAGISETEIMDFMGWTRTGNMVANYFSASAAGLDAKVFTSHPYLEMWK